MRFGRMMGVFVWISLALLAPAWGQKPAGQKTPLRVDDLFLFDQPLGAVLSPDGTTLAYTRQWIDRNTREERQALWLVSEKRENAIAAEPDEPDASAPLFSPDGQWIAFRSTRPRPSGWRQTPTVPLQSEPATDIWLMNLRDKKVVPLAPAEKPYGRVFSDPFYSRMAFSPDGKRLAFVADDGLDLRHPDELDNHVIVVRPDHGEGYTGYRNSQIWVAELDPQPRLSAATGIKRLTNDDVWWGDPQWSPDSKTLVVHANRTNDRESVRFSINKNFDLWAIDVDSAMLRQLTTGEGADVSARFSPNGKKLLCLSSPRKGPHGDIYNFTLLDISAKMPVTKTLFDHHQDDGRTPPHPTPAFPLPDNAWLDNDHIVYTANVGTSADRFVLNVSTGFAEPMAGKLQVSAEPALRRLAEEQKKRTDLLPQANRFLNDRLLGETKTIRWENGEGQIVEGVLTTPHADLAEPPYKLLVYPHGGPHSRSTTAFHFMAEVFAGQGYAVFQPNFRGSVGYGRKFLDADRNDFGGGDMRDILAGVDYLVKQQIVNPKRQFVFGSSYGGFMTTWLTGHTNQFRAAAAQNAVTDLHAMWGLSDIQSWTEWEFRGLPWEVSDAMRKHSPLTYVDKVITPTLVLHARDDRRVPLPMGQMYYQALLRRNVPTQMVIYPDEGHGIKQPRHRKDLLNRVLAWFEKYDER